MPERVFTCDEGKERLRVSDPILRDLLRATKIAAMRVGARGQWRSCEGAVRSFLRGANGTAEPQQATP
jgi:hypothetical protein